MIEKQSTQARIEGFNVIVDGTKATVPQMCANVRETIPVEANEATGSPAYSHGQAVCDGRQNGNLRIALVMRLQNTTEAVALGDRLLQVTRHALCRHVTPGQVGRSKKALEARIAFTRSRGPSG